MNRAFGIAVSPDRQHVTCYLPASTSAPTIACFEENGTAAVVFTRPSTHETLQLKGTVQEIRVAEESDRSVIEGHLDRLIAELELVGLPERVTRRLTHWPAHAVTIRVEAVFEQTPGPQAGCRLEE